MHRKGGEKERKVTWTRQAGAAGPQQINKRSQRLVRLEETEEIRPRRLSLFEELQQAEEQERIREILQQRRKSQQLVEKQGVQEKQELTSMKPKSKMAAVTTPTPTPTATTVVVTQTAPSTSPKILTTATGAISKIPVKDVSQEVTNDEIKAILLQFQAQNIENFRQNKEHTDKRFEETIRKIDEIRKEQGEIKTEQKLIKKEVEKIKESNKTRDLKTEVLEKKVEMLEELHRRANVVIRNLPERTPDLTKERILNWLHGMDIQNGFIPEQILTVYRLGRKGARLEPRNIMVKFANVTDKVRLMAYLKQKGTSALKHENVDLEVYNDIAFEERMWRQSMKPLTKFFQAKGIRYNWVYPRQVNFWHMGRKIQIRENTSILDVLVDVKLIDHDSPEWEKMKEELKISGGLFQERKLSEDEPKGATGGT